LETVDVAGIEDVVADRFGDASDWTFSLSGDFDRDEVVRLARTYLGTLPGSGRVEDPGFVEPPPPEGIVAMAVDGGTGEQARLALYFSERADPTREDHLLAALVESEAAGDGVVEVVGGVVVVGVVPVVGVVVRVFSATSTFKLTLIPIRPLAPDQIRIT